MLLGKVQCKSTLLETCQALAIFSMDGDSTHVVSMVDFWMGGVDQRTCGPCPAAPTTYKPTKQLPRETY